MGYTYTKKRPNLAQNTPFQSLVNVLSKYMALYHRLLGHLSICKVIFENGSVLGHPTQNFAVCCDHPGAFQSGYILVKLSQSYMPPL